MGWTKCKITYMFLVRDTTSMTTLDLLEEAMEFHALLLVWFQTDARVNWGSYRLKVPVHVEIISNPLPVSFSWLIIPYDRIIADMNPGFAKLDILNSTVVTASLGWSCLAWMVLSHQFLECHPAASAIPNHHPMPMVAAKNKEAMISWIHIRILREQWLTDTNWISLWLWAVTNWETLSSSCSHWLWALRSCGGKEFLAKDEDDARLGRLSIEVPRLLPPTTGGLN